MRFIDFPTDQEHLKDLKAVMRTVPLKTFAVDTREVHHKLQTGGAKERKSDIDTMVAALLSKQRGRLERAAPKKRPASAKEPDEAERWTKKRKSEILDAAVQLYRDDRHWALELQRKLFGSERRPSRLRDAMAVVVASVDSEIRDNQRKLEASSERPCLRGLRVSDKGEISRVEPPPASPTLASLLGQVLESKRDRKKSFERREAAGQLRKLQTGLYCDIVHLARSKGAHIGPYASQFGVLSAALRQAARTREDLESALRLRVSRNTGMR